MTTFEGLSGDVLVLILGSIDSPRDLHRLILASPIALRTFRPIRSSILNAVVQNMYTPLALPTALAIIYLPEIEHIPEDIPDEERSALAAGFMQPALNRYFNQHALAIPADTPRIRRLFRLHAMVSRFVHEFVQHATRRMTWSPVDIGVLLDPDFSVLSHSERTRFERTS